MYIRKTKDIYEIQGDYGYGWDVLTIEETRKEVFKRLKEYNESEIGIYHRIVKKREYK